MLTRKEFWLNGYLMEGINIDVDNKVVTFTDNNENYVDTSIESNPTISTNAISVFKRKKDENKQVSDENPLVYALKGMRGWTISEEDRASIWNRIKEILNKLPNEYDMVVVPESNSGIVATFADAISKHFDSIPIIKECLLKRTLDEVVDDINWIDFSKEEQLEITDAFKKMKGGHFEAKYFPKSLAHRLEASIYKSNPHNKGVDVANKRVIMIDDVVSTGMSLSHCANVLKREYFPKTITNIVLFSEAT